MSRGSPIPSRSGRVALVYFSGHGGNDEKGRQFVCPIEVKRMLLGDYAPEVYVDDHIVHPLRPGKASAAATGLALPEIWKRSCNIVIIDACRVGSGSKTSR